jgi:hypothetical protein
VSSGGCCVGVHPSGPISTNTNLNSPLNGTWLWALAGTELGSLLWLLRTRDRSRRIPLKVLRRAQVSELGHRPCFRPSSSLGPCCIAVRAVPTGPLAQPAEALRSIIARLQPAGVSRAALLGLVVAAGLAAGRPRSRSRCPPLATPRVPRAPAAACCR